MALSSAIQSFKANVDHFTTYLESIPANSWTATFVTLIPIIDVIYLTIKENELATKKIIPNLEALSSRTSQIITDAETAHETWKLFDATQEERASPEYHAYLTERQRVSREVNPQAKALMDEVFELNDLAKSVGSTNALCHLLILTLLGTVKKVSGLFLVGILIYTVTFLTTSTYVSFWQSTRIQKLTDTATACRNSMLSSFPVDRTFDNEFQKIARAKTKRS